MTNSMENNGFVDDIRAFINEARKQVVHTVNTVMVATYWEIGRRIVEEEQNGNDRAEYGKYLIKNLAEVLTADFGKGFGETNLKYFRQFYLTFPIRHTLCGELSECLFIEPQICDSQRHKCLNLSKYGTQCVPNHA